MNKFIIVLGILILPLLSFAHYPLSAKYYLEASDEISILNIYLSQDGVNKAMIAKHGVEKINKMSTAEYKELIVAYVRANFDLTLDGEEAELLEGGIKLGDHQTDLKFILTPISANTNEVEVFIPAFMENEEHQTIFSYSLFGATEKVILNAKNDFRSTIVIGEESGSAGIIWLAGGLTLAILLSMFIWRKFARVDSPELAVG